MSVKGQVLLINPWIYDFAAYNLWSEPLGLLTIAGVLDECGYAVSVLDCLAPHPGAPHPRPDGSGKFLKTWLEKPEPVAFVPRRFGRYGLPLAEFDTALSAMPTPDLILVASGMTYWYPGVVEAVRRVRMRFGTIPVAVGGVYATLCPAHAHHCTGADWVISGPGVVAALRLADEATGHNSEPERYLDPHTWPPAIHGLVPRPFAGIITSWGCPFRCTYCASRRLQPTFIQRRPSAVVDEIAKCVERGITDLAFYDDALLVDAGCHIEPILEGVLERGLSVRLHTPNGLHAKEVSSSLALLMRQAGFATVRLSLETIDSTRQRVTGAKVSTESFLRAVSHLRAAGFDAQQMGAYVLAGLPGQPLSEVEATVQFVQRMGMQAKLALFSPIPGTPDGDRALPAETDPLLHNNTVYPYLLGDDFVRELQLLKQLTKEGNLALLRQA